MKARIRVKALENNCHTIFNGKTWAVVHKSDIKQGLQHRIDYLNSIGCKWSAEQIMKCVRVN